MPEVADWPNPNGSPIATTKSPTWSFEESASGSATRAGARIWITATSVCGSVPTSLALYDLPSVRVTLMSSAPAITWLLVRM